MSVSKDIWLLGYLMPLRVTKQACHQVPYNYQKLTPTPQYATKPSLSPASSQNLVISAPDDFVSRYHQFQDTHQQNCIAAKLSKMIGTETRSNYSNCGQVPPLRFFFLNKYYQIMTPILFLLMAKQIGSKAHAFSMCSNKHLLRIMT